MSYGFPLFMSPPPPQVAGADGFSSLIVVPAPKTYRIDIITVCATTADLLFTLGLVTDGSGLLDPSNVDPELRHGSYLYYEILIPANNTFRINGPMYLAPGHELRFMGGMVNGFGEVIG